MDKKVVILNSDDEIIANAYLESLASNTAVIRFNSLKMAKKLKKLLDIRFRISGNYVETFEGIVTEIKENTLIIKNLKDVAVKYREDIKVDVDYKGIITFYEEEQINNIAVRVRDISSSGLCFYSKIDLKKEYTYETVIPVTKIPIILNFQIVRKLQSEEESVYIYGCKFIKLGIEEEKMLREAVFRLHSLKYRRNK